MNDIFSAYQRLRQNPIQMLSRRFNIPNNVDLNNPNDILQHLINSGQISQQQINQAMSMRNNPMIQRLINGKWS